MKPLTFTSCDDPYQLHLVSLAIILDKYIKMMQTLLNEDHLPINLLEVLSLCNRLRSKISGFIYTLETSDDFK